MKVYTILRNLVQSIKSSLAEAKDYADANLQTSKTFRKPDYNSMIFPIATSQQARWTYTAPSDGYVLLAFFSMYRVYIGIFVNGVRIFDYASSNTNGGGTYASPVTVPLGKGDEIDVQGLNANTWLGTTTAFVPFVGG